MSKRRPRPFIWLALRATTMALRQSRMIRRLREQRERDLALLSDSGETAKGWEEMSGSWRRRAEALYLIADPDLRDGVILAVLSIENLPEVPTP